MKIILILTPLLLLTACLKLSVPTRIPIQNSNSAHCPKWDSGDTIKITENTTIPKNCHYDKVSFVISKSNITFDCNDAELNGLGKTKMNEFYRRYKVREVPSKVAFNIAGSENNFLQNVTVKNCNLLFYMHGFSVAFGLNKETHKTLKSEEGDIESLENHLRKLSPKNIRIENNKIEGSHRVGIYVHRFVTDLIINNNTITRTGSAGIYLDSGSQKITISNSYFTKNGGKLYDTESRKIKPRVTHKREAIAIDSSAYNTIKGNKFVNNEGGAIFIYKNCYEGYKEAGPLPRHQSSNFNLIENNTFSDEEKGVWIASRQSRDLNNFKCGDPAIQVKGSEKYYEDFAKENRIINNTFDFNEKAIIVEDDNNTISNNHFKNTKRKDIIIGTEKEVKDVITVNGTIVRNNIFSSKPSVWLRFNPTGSIFSGNKPRVSVRESTK